MYYLALIALLGLLVGDAGMAPATDPGPERADPPSERPSSVRIPALILRLGLVAGTMLTAVGAATTRKD